MCGGGCKFDLGFGFGRWFIVSVSVLFCLSVNFCWVSCGRWGGGGGGNAGCGSCVLWSGSSEGGEVEIGGRFRFWAEFFCGQCGHGSSVVGMMLHFVGLWRFCGL